MPAVAIGRPELGTLSVGAEADVALLRLEKGTFSYRDCGFGRMDGEHRLSCVMTLRKGNVVWDRDARTTQRWEALPEDYWEVTEVPVPIQRHWR